MPASLLIPVLMPIANLEEAAAEHVVIIAVD